MKKLKIFYVNGYGGENSNKPEVLSKMLNTKVTHFKVDYNKLETLNLSELKSANLIIASSTGSYLARKVCEDNNIPLVSVNPIINENVLKTTFKKLNADVPKIDVPRGLLLDEIIFVTADDELIDYQKAKLSKSDNIVVFNKGGHRFLNMERIQPKLLEFMKFLYIS